MSDTINIIKDNIDNEVGVWFYASSLLKEYNIENTGRNQYQLFIISLRFRHGGEKTTNLC